MKSSKFLRRVHNVKSSFKIGLLEQMATVNNLNTYQELARVIEDSHKSSLLELGCGTGTLLRYLNWEGTYLGLDISDASIEEAVEEFGSDKIRFQVRDIEAIPSEDGVWDMVCAHMVVHLLSDLDKVLTEVHRVLTPSGSFHMVVPAYHRANESETCQRYNRVVDSLNTFVPPNNLRYDNPFFKGRDAIVAFFQNAFGPHIKILETPINWKICCAPSFALSYFVAGLYQFSLIPNDRKPQAAAKILETLIDIENDRGLVHMERPLSIWTITKKLSTTLP